MPQSTRPAYYLQNISIAEVATTPHDLVVVDRDIGRGGGIVSAAEVARMKGADGARTVLGYMSTGEAEDYRSYWQDSWSASPPSWLGPENPDWEGNYRTRFWEPGWRDMLFGEPGDYLDTLIAAGFDGVFLDVVDVYQTAWARRQNPDAEEAMVELVLAIGAYARAKDPGFRIYVNNAEALLARPDYLAAIDGQLKEELFYSGGAPNTAEEVAWSSGLLNRAHAAGKDVLVVEYLTDEAAATDADARADALGFGIYVADLELGSLDQHGTAGGDSLAGGAGPNRLLGLAGNDTLVGKGGTDSLYGGNGADRLYGQAGRDMIWGDAGADVIAGGPGDDVLSGGAGRDIFVLQAGHGTDRIQDFTSGTDRLKLVGVGGPAEVTLQTADMGGASGLLVTFAGGSTFLRGVTGIGSGELIFA